MATPYDSMTEFLAQLKLPKEVLDRITGTAALSQFGNEQQEGIMNEYFAQGDAVAKSAEQKRIGLEGTIKKPLPINANLMALNSAFGAFSQSLSPKGNFIQRADDRRAFEIGEMKERRMEQLKLQEQDYMQEAKRAQEMGDFKARQTAITKAQNFTQLRQSMMDTMGDYYKSKDKQTELLMQHAYRIDEIATKARTEGNRKLPPEIQAQLTTLDKSFAAENEAIDIQLRNTSSIFDAEEKDKQIRSLMSKKRDLVGQYAQQRTQLIGLAPAVEDTPAGEPKKLEVITGDIVRSMMRENLTVPQMNARIDDLLSDPSDQLWEDTGLDPDTVDMRLLKQLLTTQVRVMSSKYQSLKSDYQKTRSNINPRAPLGITRTKQAQERLRQIQEEMRNILGVEPGEEFVLPGTEEAFYNVPGVFVR